MSIDPKKLAEQLRKPTGENGIKVGENLNQSNRNLYNLMFSMLNLKNNDSILEIGYGNGRLFKEYFDINNNISVFGLDFSETMYSEALKNTQDLVNLKLSCGDSKVMDFADNQFDKIIILNTIYFWNPIKEYFSEISRVLKSGGEILIGFTPKHLMEKINVFCNDCFNLYEVKDLEEILNKTGFKIKDIKEKTFIRKIEEDEIEYKTICVLAVRG